jgi:hypothetical protein
MLDKYLIFQPESSQKKDYKDKLKPPGKYWKAFVIQRRNKKALSPDLDIKVRYYYLEICSYQLAYGDNFLVLV